ncbi:MAG: hypothetical protein H7Y36_06045 [Armatimonadetes bacterium]|nr:hypothetical protein [Akkermansiaceae bacterium]
MKIKTIFSIICGLAFSLQAQNLDKADEQNSESDSVRKAIDEFNRLKGAVNDEANEVTVVLEPPAPRAIAVDENVDVKPSAEKTEKPVLVTGKPPKEQQQDAPTNPKEAENAPAILGEPESAKTTEPGLEVRVESIRKGTGKIDPSQVKLKSSFPAKPLSSAPGGWKLEKVDTGPAFERDVQLSSGTTISLSIRPHILTPESDGVISFSIPEPGFQALDGYQQQDTVSAILGKSVVQLDEDSKHFGEAIDRLQQILASLPKPESEVDSIDQP